MKRIYRFRRCDEHSIDALRKCTIQGSKYCTMSDQNEVLLKVDNDILTNVTRIDKSIVSGTTDIIRKHILDSYYIACFTTEDHLDKLDMWKEYADNIGFCLVYDEATINNAIKLSLALVKTGFHLFRNVDYGNEPTDVTSFVKDFLELVGNDIDSEERYQYAANRVGDNLSLEERKRLTNSMFHKIGEFPEKAEKRIVSLHYNHKSNWCNDIIGISVKPVAIIISSLMEEPYKKQIRRIAKKKGIPLSVKQIS